MMMKRIFRFLLHTSVPVVILGLLIGAGCAGSRVTTKETEKQIGGKVMTGSGSPLYPFTKRTLSNGLTVIVKEVHTVPIVAVYFWVRTGSFNESEENNGISHFFEHMFFKGTTKRGVGEMDRIIKELGGYNNALTSIEYTGYYVVVPSENFSTAFDVLYDAMVNSVFDPKEVDKERQVIKEEINRKEDRPEEKLFDEFISVIFQGTPYAQPVLGTSEILDKINHDKFIEYLHTFYVPNNVIVAVVGDVETDKILSHIQESVSVWKPNQSIKKKQVTFDFVPQKDNRAKVIEKDVNQCYWILGLPNYGRLTLRDMYVLDVASTILGSGRSSRLYTRIVEREGLASSINAWSWPLKKAGVLGVDAEFPEQNLEKVQKAVFEEIERMKSELVNPSELAKAKMMLKTDFAYANETDSNVAQTLGEYEAISKAEEALTYLDQIITVSAEEIKSTLNKYCNLNACTICYVKPKPSSTPVKEK